MKRTFRFEPRLQDVEEDVRREIEAHLAERSREFEAQGMAPEAARQAAIAAFGDRGAIEAEVRAVHRQTVTARRRTLRWDELRQDVLTAVRGLVRSPLYTAVALLALAVGIGANTATFSVLRSVVMRPLPYPDSGELVQVWTDHRARGRAEPEWLSPPQYFAIRDQVPAFSAIAGYQGWGPSLTGEGDPEALAGAAVNADFLTVLQVPPALGRGFSAADDDANAAPVVILTDGLWRRRFGGDPGVLGRTIQLSGQGWQVIGVMPASFRPPEPWQILRPIRRPVTSRCNHGCIVLRAIARLAPGATIEQASQQTAAAIARLIPESPEDNSRVGSWLVPLQDQLVGPVRPALLALAGAVAFVLLIACVNLASLTTVRAAARTREFGVRAALGAGRGRIVRQLLTETVVLALMGGGLGIAAGVVGTRVLAALIPTQILEVQAIGVDAVAVMTMVGVTLLAGLLFGLLPALQGAQPNLMGVLRTANPDDGRRAGMVRRGLVVAELALALVLLVGAGLLLRTLVNLQRTDLGFQPGQLIITNVAYPSARFPEIATVSSNLEQVLEQLRRHPAIAAAEVDDVPPLAPGGDQDVTALPDGRIPPPGVEPGGIWYRSVSPGTPRLLGMRLVAGREFGPEDRAGAGLSVIITEEAARRLWPGEDPIGRFFTSGPDPDSQRATVIGVVADVRHDGPREPLKMQAFFSVAQMPTRGTSLLILPSGDPAAAISAIREIIRDNDPQMPLGAISSFSERLQAVTALPRQFALIVGAFATSAVVLALIGVYGMMAYAVGQRRREIGVRLALGAAPAAMLRWIVAEGMWLTAVGVGLGVLVAAATTRVLSASLHGVDPLDRTTFVVLPLVLGLAALLACWIPARRARNIDPVEALRAE
ncbi:MAG: ABC transporter permease [Gemmatimonadota bacterium]|nr:ABC transporter permease [Gemmatimonadota bacterium]